MNFFEARVDVLEDEKQALQEKLDIAVKALEFYAKPFCQFNPEYNVAQHHKRAQEALAKIKEIKRCTNT